mgnify:FL=1
MVGKEESRAKALIILFTDMERKKAFLPKGDPIYLDGNLTLAQVADCKENMPMGA